MLKSLINMIIKINISGLIFIFGLLLTSNIYAQNINDLDNSVEIESYPLEEISGHLNTPYRMSFVLSGQYIAVTDINNVPSVHIIKKNKANDYEYLKGIGREGRGPTEYIDPNVVISDSDGEYFYVHDAGNMKIVKYNSEFEALTDEEINIRPNGMPISIHFFKDQF